MNYTEQLKSIHIPSLYCKFSKFFNDIKNSLTTPLNGFNDRTNYLYMRMQQGRINVAEVTNFLFFNRKNHWGAKFKNQIKDIQ